MLLGEGIIPDMAMLPPLLPALLVRSCVDMLIFQFFMARMDALLLSLIRCMAGLACPNNSSHEITIIIIIPEHL